MRVTIRPEARDELARLPAAELVAIDHAIQKLAAAGERLAYPHSSAVRIAEGLRELRPRQGRSQWRAFYRRVGPVMVVASIGPEAGRDSRGFARAVADAVARLADEEGSREDNRDG